MECWQNGAYLIIRMDKELDHHQAEKVQEQIEHLRREKPYKHLVFDFSETTFMDSSGVGMLIRQYKTMSMSGGDVCASGVRPMLDKLFYVSGLHKIIRIYPEWEDALNGKK